MLILGINPGSHDSAACIVSDGLIMAACEEERLTRRKHAFEQMPWRATLHCLSHVGAAPGDIDYVALPWAAAGQPEHSIHICKNAEVEAEAEYYRHTLFPRHVFGDCRLPRFAHVSHHLAHAASAYRCSPFNEAAVLIVDGQGDHAATTIAHGRHGQVELVARFGIDASLGYFYQAATEHIGFGHFGGEGQTMALAAFGTRQCLFDEIETHADGYSVNWGGRLVGNVTGDRVRQLWLQRLSAVVARYRGAVDAVAYSAEGKGVRDLAASAQGKLAEVVVHLAKQALRWTGCSNLALAGGVALNCAANGEIARATEAPIFVFPAAGDAGAAVGAALELSAALGMKVDQPFPSVYLGPAFSSEACESALSRSGLSFRIEDDPAQSVAHFIADGSVIGWFQGAAEFGPRALGNRSILGDPRRRDIRDRVNSRVKHRAPWRPFAPSVSAECVDRLFGGAVSSPHMLVATRVPASLQETIAGVVHADQTTRLQTVAPEDNPVYHKLLHRCGATLGLPAVLNTSFNDAGEPMVCSPEDAIRTFQNTALDYLVLGPFIVGPKQVGTA